MLKQYMVIGLTLLLSLTARADFSQLPKGSRFILQRKDGSVSGVDKSYYGFALVQPAERSPHSIVPLALQTKTDDREFGSYIQGADGYSMMLTQRFARGQTTFYLETKPKPTQLISVPGYASLFDIGNHQKLVGWISTDGRPQLARFIAGGSASDFQLHSESLNISKWYSPKVYGVASVIEPTVDGVLVATDRFLLKYRFVSGTGAAVIVNQYDLSPLKTFFYTSALKITGLWTNGDRGWLAVSNGGVIPIFLPFEIQDNNQIVFHPGRQLANKAYLDVVDVEANGDLVFNDVSHSSATQFIRSIYVLGFEGGQKHKIAHLEFSDLNESFKLQAWINRVLFMDRASSFDMGMGVAFARTIGPRDFDEIPNETFAYDFSGTVFIDYPRRKFYPNGRSAGRSIMDVASENGQYRLQVLSNEIDELPLDARLTVDQFVAEFLNRLVEYRKKHKSKKILRYFEIVSDDKIETEQNPMIAPWEDYLTSIRVDSKEFIAVVQTSPRLKSAILKAHPIYLKAWNITTQPQISLIHNKSDIIVVAEFAKIASDSTCTDVLSRPRPLTPTKVKVLEFIPKNKKQA